MKYDVHCRNIKRLSNELDRWMKSNLQEFSVIELGYNHYDLDCNHYLAVSNNLSWRDVYIEHGFDIDSIHILEEGIRVLDNKDTIKACYNKHFIADSVRTLFCFRASYGFVTFSTLTPKHLTHQQQNLVMQRLRHGWYEVRRACKTRPHLFTPLQHRSLIKEKFVQPPKKFDIEYQRSVFQDIVFTAKEQQYIEYLLFHLSPKDIADKHQCSETAVRRAIIRIKQKLGNQNFTTSELLLNLRERGMLTHFHAALG